jgi:RHS repeat-associated protein
VQRARYTYWNDGEYGGDGGCLKTVAVEHYNPSTSAWDLVKENYYRYYEPEDSEGPAGALKYVFGPAAVAKLRQVFPTSWDTLENGILLRPYADMRFAYGAGRRVVRERIHGFAELLSYDYLVNGPEHTGYNEWHTRTIETLPDLSTNTVLSNTAGRTLLHVFTETGTGTQWPRLWVYYEGDGQAGRLKYEAGSSAIDSFSVPASAGTAFTVSLKSGGSAWGPVISYSYYADDDTVSPGRFKATYINAGADFAHMVKLRERAYLPGDGSSTKVTPLVSEKVYLAAGYTAVNFGYQYHHGGFTGGGGDAPEDIEIPVANNVGADIVFEQQKPSFDRAGNMILSTRWMRLHSTSGTDAGELEGPSEASCQALRSYTAYWPDGIGRIHASAEYGTNAGNSLSPRPDVCPAASDSILVSRSRFLVSGAPERYESVAPDGTVTRSENDPMGRRIRLWENFDSGKDATHLDANRLTEYAYHISGKLNTLTAWNRRVEGGVAVIEEQSTRWAYGTTLTDSAIATGHLLRAKIYPDSDDTAGDPPADGPDGFYRRSEFTYNQLAEVTQFTDPAGTVHTYRFDQFGRLVDDVVPTLASGVDGTIRRIARTYADDGRAVTISSWNGTSGGTILNEVKQEYNAWGQLHLDWQAHGGAVSGGALAVEYAYSDGSDNHLRLIQMIYPNGTEVEPRYNAGVDERLGRITSFGYPGSSTFTPILDFSYAGVAIPVHMVYPEPGLQWTILSQSGENPLGKTPYAGVDNFGRLVKARWLTTETSPATRVHVNYWYDRGSRRTWREVPNAPSVNKESERYGYDGLSQLTNRQRGLLMTGGGGPDHIDPAPEREEQFTYDVLGNWQQYTVKQPDTVNPATQQNLFAQSRSHNAANQITGFSNSDQPVAHDPAGNLTSSAPSPDLNWSIGMSYQWDPWNRLTKITNSETGDEVAHHAYDGLTRRTTLREGGISGTVRHFYYNTQWRSVEERLGTSADPSVPEDDPERQHLYNPLDRWHLILRDRNSSPSSGSESSGSGPDILLDERLYCLHDALDPVALANTMGEIVERYNFSAFGMRRIMNASFGTLDATAISSAGLSWNWGFHGEFLDNNSAFYNYGFRFYSAFLGRWLGFDRLGEQNGANLATAFWNASLNYFDFLGDDPEVILPFGGGMSKNNPFVVPDADKYMGPGPFFNPFHVIDASGAKVKEKERNQLFSLDAVCHTCGEPNWGTKKGRPVGDHQQPTSLLRPGESWRDQVLVPQCLTCSNKSGRAFKDQSFVNQNILATNSVISGASANVQRGSAAAGGIIMAANLLTAKAQSVLFEQKRDQAIGECLNQRLAANVNPLTECGCCKIFIGGIITFEGVEVPYDSHGRYTKGPCPCIGKYTETEPGVFPKYSEHDTNFYYFYRVPM